MLLPSVFSRRAMAAALLVASTVAVAAPIARSDVAPIYVSNFSSGSVVSYDANSGNQLSPSFPTGAAPVGLASSGGDLFVAYYHGSSVVEYNEQSGATVNVFADANGPNGVFVSGTTLYVSNDTNGTISEYDTTTGLPVNASLVSGLSKPYSVAVQGNDLLVADAGNNRIGEYNATTGQALNVSFIGGLEYPTGLAISGTTLFVAAPTTGVGNGTGSKIGSYDLATGNANNTAIITAPQGVYSIAALAGDILVPNFSTNTLSEYDGTSGNLIKGNFISGFSGAYGIAVENTPEPGSASLICLGCFYLVSRRRRTSSPARHG